MVLLDDDGLDKYADGTFQSTSGWTAYKYGSEFVTPDVGTGQWEGMTMEGTSHKTIRLRTNCNNLVAGHYAQMKAWVQVPSNYHFRCHVWRTVANHTCYPRIKFGNTVIWTGAAQAGTAISHGGFKVACPSGNSINTYQQKCEVIDVDMSSYSGRANYLKFELYCPSNVSSPSYQNYVTFDLFNDVRNANGFTDWYVGDSGKNDLNTGVTDDQSFKTIHKAMNVAGDGDTIHVYYLPSVGNTQYYTDEPANNDLSPVNDNVKVEFYNGSVFTAAKIVIEVN